MRLHPPVSQDEALSWLRTEALQHWPELGPDFEENLSGLAKALAVVSSFEIPEDVEP